MTNNVTLMGRIGEEVRIRDISDKFKKIEFSVANTISIKDEKAENGYSEKVTWISAIAWNKKAEFIEKHFRKGDRIIIVGKLGQQNWVNKDEQKQSRIVLRINEIEKLDWEKKDNIISAEMNDDELPF